MRKSFCHLALQDTFGKMSFFQSINGGVEITQLKILPLVRWTELPPMITPRSEAGAVCLDDDHVLVISGRSKGERPTSVELLTHSRADGGTWSWREVAESPNHFEEPGVMLMDDGRVLVAGGMATETQLFDPPRGHTDLGQWTVLKTESRGYRYGHLINFCGRILLFGEDFLFFSTTPQIKVSL